MLNGADADGVIARFTLEKYQEEVEQARDLVHWKEQVSFERGIEFLGGREL